MTKEQIKEIDDISDALCRWLASQSAPKGLGTLALLNVAACSVAALANDPDDLAVGLDDSAKYLKAVGAAFYKHTH